MGAQYYRRIVADLAHIALRIALETLQKEALLYALHAFALNAPPCLGAGLLVAVAGFRVFHRKGRARRYALQARVEFALVGAFPFPAHGNRYPLEVAVDRGRGLSALGNGTDGRVIPKRLTPYKEAGQGECRFRGKQQRRLGPAVQAHIDRVECL